MMTTTTHELPPPSAEDQKRAIDFRARIAATEHAAAEHRAAAGRHEAAAYAGRIVPEKQRSPEQADEIATFEAKREAALASERAALADGDAARAGLAAMDAARLAAADDVRKAAEAALEAERERERAEAREIIAHYRQLAGSAGPFTRMSGKLLRDLFEFHLRADEWAQKTGAAMADAHAAAQRLGESTVEFQGAHRVLATLQANALANAGIRARAVEAGVHPVTVQKVLGEWFNVS